MPMQGTHICQLVVVVAAADVRAVVA
jgi:hypothetical protein